jgi:hypothetical protein
MNPPSGGLVCVQPRAASIARAAVFSAAPHGTIEAVRGRLTDARGEEILSFWASQGALEGAEARERLGEVVAVLLDDAGAIAGVNSAFPSEVPLLGGRRFWVHRSLFRPGSEGAWPAIAHVAFVTLQAEFNPGADVPVGLCIPVDDPARMQEHPEAEWLYPRSIYAGYMADGRQARIRYFEGSRIERPRAPDDFAMKLDRRYRIDVFAEQEAIRADDVLGLWAREGVVGEDEAGRRVHEVLVVAGDESRKLVALSTAYLQRSAQLRMDLWHLRTFVAPEHRMSRVAWGLSLAARDHLQRRFVGGLDTRGQGMVFEIENEFLKQHFDEALWLPLDVTFIGANERGDHVRVHYFPGAVAPEPPQV